MSERALGGRYEIVEKIGDGGMAVVYRGRDRLLNRFVAIKVLRPEYTKDFAFVDNFRKESQAAARLNHPNIVSVYDVGKEENIHYIVMELVEGRTLSDLIAAEAPLDYKRAISIAKQVASALTMAHKNNIIHRDVKPHNILIMPDGNVKITDFGIARAVSDATIVKNAGEGVMGSVHYFSPEQARGGYVDEKSDIYSLGIVLYEMLVGKVPFDAENPVAVAVMHMNDKPTPPSQLVSGVPPGLEQIVMKAVEKYQINRFKSAEDVYEALDNVNFVTGIIENPEVAEKLRQNAASGEETGGADDEGRVANYTGEDGSEKKKKKMKTGKGKIKILIGKHIKLRVLAVLLALVCAIPVSMFIYSGMQQLKAPSELELPSVLGMTEDDAKELLESMKLELIVADSAYSSEYAEGLISSQERPEGSIVKEGFKLRVNLSRGEAPDTDSPPTMSAQEEEITVPNVSGISLSDAIYILESYGYGQGDVSRENSTLPVDYVVRQSPDARTEGTPGMKINLVLSDGPETISNVAMPSLIGLSENEAKTALTDKGLDVGVVTREASASYAEGLVIKQQHATDTELPTGAKVNITVSAGPPSDEPRSVSLNIDFSAAPSEVFNLSVILSDSSGRTSNIVNEAVRYKSAGSESVSVTGQGTATVYVMFSGDPVMVYTIDFTTGNATLQ
ncbi:MAG: Stk1 family PASTA domain-containing Ser/Thr kinase [Clostridiales Family XIII bacterium]|jgi:serine/threonine-protein kinase|nr:Stk1 family PASTA domain-containing Ser/Thr kinase [Clostridiales Family XIII bacterium]